MAGLSCGEISRPCMAVTAASLNQCLSITDDAIAPLMAGFADSAFSTEPIEAGECSDCGPGVAGCTAGSSLWDSLGLDAKSHILLIGTRATDPSIYQDLTKREHDADRA